MVIFKNRNNAVKYDWRYIMLEGYTKEKNVTLPILKKIDNEPFYVKISGAIFQGKPIKQNGETPKNPANLVPVINLDTGEEMLVVINKVLGSIFEENYPDNEYISKCFEIEQYQVENKEYKSFKVVEISAKAVKGGKND